MTKPRLPSLLTKAKAKLMALMTEHETRTGRSGATTPVEMPFDAVASHHDTIKRLAEVQSDKMRITNKPAVLLPAVGVLNDHLREMFIEHTDISDISALSALPNLEVLEISSAEVRDFSVLAQLPRLRSLTINYGTDAPLHVPDLPALRHLTVQNTHGAITLGHLPQLEQAKFQVLQDLSQVTRQPRLKELYVQSVASSTFAPLAQATELRSLDIWMQAAQDLSPLANLSKLTRLRIVNVGELTLNPMDVLANPDLLRSQPRPENTGLRDLSPLGALTALQDLSLDGPQTSDASPLASLINLTHLCLRPSVPLVDLSFLAGMTKLTELILPAAAPADLSVLKGLPVLADLRLANMNPDLDLTPLSSCMALKNLFIRTNNDHAMPAPLPAPPRLISIGLYGAGLDSLEGLEDCAQLERVSCERTRVSNLDPLKGLTNLAYLGLQGTQVANLSVLTTLPLFLARDPRIGLSVEETPVLDHHPALKAIAAEKFDRDTVLDKPHKTALIALTALGVRP